MPDTTTVTITDNDTPGTLQFSAATYSVSENAGPATVRVTRTGTNLASNVTVQFATTNGTATAPADYADATRILSVRGAARRSRTCRSRSSTTSLPKGTRRSS